MCFLDSYEDAAQFTNQQRNVEPAVYNYNRLNELPIPSIRKNRQAIASTIRIPSDSSNSSIPNAETDGTNDSIRTQNDDSINENTDAINNSSVSNDEMNGTSSINIQNVENGNSINNNAINPIETIDSHSNEEDVCDAEISIQNIEEVSNDVEVDPLLITATDIKAENELMNMLNIHADNNEEINNILDEPEKDIYDDDLIFFVGPTGYPNPVNYSTKFLIKRENDEITGNILYNISVSIYYYIGIDFIEKTTSHVKEIIIINLRYQQFFIKNANESNNVNYLYSEF